MQNGKKTSFRASSLSYPIANLDDMFAPLFNAARLLKAMSDKGLEFERTSGQKALTEAQQTHGLDSLYHEPNKIKSIHS